MTKVNDKRKRQWETSTGSVTGNLTGNVNRNDNGNGNGVASAGSKGMVKRVK